MKTLLFVNHLSPFGYAFMQEALRHSFFQIDQIFLPGERLYLDFTRKLKQLPRLPNEQKFRKNYRRKTKNVEASLRKQSPHIVVTISSEVNTPEVVELINSYEIALSAAFPAIFSKRIIQAGQKGIINFHPSYLPRCRGANPVYWTIASGEDYGGLSAHFMTTKIDAGPIVAREKILFDKDVVTYLELYNLAIEKINPLLKQTASFLAKGKQATLQKEDQKSYFREPLQVHKKINWREETAVQISAKIRAGGAYTFYRGERLRLTKFLQIKSRIAMAANNYDQRLAPGLIVNVSADVLWIKCLDAYLQVGFYRNRMLEDVFNKGLKRIGLRKLADRTAFLQNRKIEIGETLV